MCPHMQQCYNYQLCVILSLIIYFCIHRYWIPFCNSMLNQLLYFLAETKKPTTRCVCACILQVLFCSVWQICVCIFPMYKFIDNKPKWNCKFTVNLKISLLQIWEKWKWITTFISTADKEAHINTVKHKKQIQTCHSPPKVGELYLERERKKNRTGNSNWRNIVTSCRKTSLIQIYVRHFQIKLLCILIKKKWLGNLDL
jgi:hypothetical protein